MKKTNDEIEIAIARAVRAIPHQAPDQLWNIPVTQAEGSEWFLDSTDSINARYSIMSMAAALRTVALAAALLVITFGLRYYLRDTRNLATIYLDINPSVSLSVNRNERVTNATAGNADGEKILAEMDLKGTDVDVAVNALIGASIRYGYLDSENAILLLSFDCANKEFQNVLQTRLTMQASDNLTQELGGGTVLDMEVSPDDSIDDLSTTYGISPGKAALLAKIVTDHPDLSCAIIPTTTGRDSSKTCTKNCSMTCTPANMLTRVPTSRTTTMQLSPCGIGMTMIGMMIETMTIGMMIGMMTIGTMMIGTMTIVMMTIGTTTIGMTMTIETMIRMTTGMTMIGTMIRMTTGIDDDDDD